MKTRRIHEWCGRLTAALVMAAIAIRADAAPDDAPGGKKPDQIEARAKASMSKGLDWLKKQQNKDGSWSNASYPAMTALGLWAFARSNHPDRDETCARAAAFIEKFVQSDGGIYKPVGLIRRSGGLSTYNTAICMIALHTYDRASYDKTIQDARKFMASCQLQGDSGDAGGFGYARPKAKRWGRPQRADLSNTAWAAYAMRVTQGPADQPPEGEKVDIDWKAVVSYVEKLQNQDKDDPENYGGFGYEAGGERGGTTVGKKDDVVRLLGYGSMTYAGLEALIYAQVDRQDPRVQSAMQWATRHWSVDENPGMGARGLFYYFNIMSKTLSLSGTSNLKDPDGALIPWKSDLVEKLASTQREDGSWVNEDNHFWEGDPCLVTCYAILSLEYVLGI